MSTKVTRVERLVTEVNREINFYTNTFGIKVNVGDSTNNKRVPTVRQVIRFLQKGLFTTELGNDLEVVYTTLRQRNLFKKVRRNNNRTDAFDINELNTVINRYVTKDSSLKAVLGRNINSV